MMDIIYMLWATFPYPMLQTILQAPENACIFVCNRNQLRCTPMIEVTFKTFL